MQQVLFQQKKKPQTQGSISDFQRDFCLGQRRERTHDPPPWPWQIPLCSTLIHSKYFSNEYLVLWSGVLHPPGTAPPLAPLCVGANRSYLFSFSWPLLTRLFLNSLPACWLHGPIPPAGIAHPWCLQRSPRRLRAAVPPCAGEELPSRAAP